MAKYVKVSEVAKRFGVTPTCIRGNIKSGSFGTSFKESGKSYLIEKNKILEIEKFFRDHIKFKEINDSILSKQDKKRIVNRHLVQEYFPGAVLSNVLGHEAWYVPHASLVNFDIKDFPILKESKSVKDKPEEFNAQKHFDESIDVLHNYTYPETIQLYREFSFAKFSDTNAKNIRALVNKHTNAISRLIKTINKEIILYNDNEIEQLLINENLKLDDKRILSVFINYLLLKHNGKCLFKNNYNKYSMENKKTISEIYTLQEWMDMTNYLTNIDLHIRKAFNDPTYAKRWLYCLLHLSIAWRTNDIMEIKPINDIEEIKEYNLEWFEKNEFTMTRAQKVINKIKILVQSITASKNGIKTHFIVLPYLVIPISIAFIAAQYHLTENKISPRNIFNQTAFNTRDLNYFFEGSQLPAFSSLKANRSLITHNFNLAVTTDGMADISYSLSSYLRSHKLRSDYELTDTTTQYIYATNEDGSPENMALHLFRRGEFGWLYNSIVKIAMSDEKLTLEEMTSNIEMLRDTFSPVAIENLASNLLNDYNERNAIINELLSKPKGEIWDIIFALNRGEMPSKEESIDCLMYNGLNHQCSYTFESNCLGCRYKIPTNYMLATVNDKLQSVIGELEQTNDSDYTQRQKYTYIIVKLLGILSEAKKEFKKWDDDYITSFVNLIELKEKIHYLEQNKFLAISGGQINAEC